MYMGSKDKIAKHILPIMLSERKVGQWWVEPFVGGANMINKVSGKRLGGDTHEYLIALHQAIQLGWTPPVMVTKKEYYDIKANPDLHPSHLVGFVGFPCSFGGKWRGGNAGKRAEVVVERASRLLRKDAGLIEGVVFKTKSYEALQIPPASIIYCDPPNVGATGYRDKFDNEAFWEWCRVKASEGHTVYVSEYSAPDDFFEVFSIDHVAKMNRGNHSKRVEKLYTIL